LRAQKKKQEKGTPTVLALRASLCFSAMAGRYKTRLRLKQVIASLSAIACDAQQAKWGERTHTH